MAPDKNVTVSAEAVKGIASGANFCLLLDNKYPMPLRKLRSLPLGKW